MARVQLVEDRIDVADDLMLGVFANAFRVTPAPRGECFLDFVVYSNEMRQARVVQRVRVRADFLIHIESLLHEEAINQENHALGSILEFVR